jgi:hypothetical protein
MQPTKTDTPAWKSGSCVRVLGEDDDAVRCPIQKYGLAEVEWYARAGAPTRLSMWRARSPTRDGIWMEISMNRCETLRCLALSTEESGT